MSFAEIVLVAADRAVDVTAIIVNAQQMAWIEYRLIVEQRTRSQIIISSRYHASRHQPINLPPGSKLSINVDQKLT